MKLLVLFLLWLATAAAVAFTWPAAATAAGGPAGLVLAPAHDGRAHGLQGVALTYWRAQGMTACPAGVEPLYADMPSLGLAEIGGCWAILQRSYVFDTLRKRVAVDGRALRRGGALMECHAWAHEIGHALGLTHDDVGRFRVMARVPGVRAIPACRWFVDGAMYPGRRHHRHNGRRG